MSQNRVAITALWIWLIATLVWWTLAMMPINSTAPEWLRVARLVCFGAQPNGMPEGFGWIMLIAAPLTFLAAIIFIWSKELVIGFRSLRQHPAGRVLIIGTLITVLVHAFWSYNKMTIVWMSEAQGYESALPDDLPEDYATRNILADDFILINQHGEAISLHEVAKNKIVLLSFVFGNCHTVCPAIVVYLREALLDIPEDDVELLLVSLDPWRDTQNTLMMAAKKWELPENAHFLSGSVEEVTKVLEDYQITYSRNLETGDIQHGALTHIINNQGRIEYSFGHAPAKWFVQAVKRLQQNGR